MNRIVFASLWILFSAACSSQQVRPEQSARIAGLIDQLHKNPWPGAQNFGIPMEWDFHFTEPMNALLEIGAAAQQPLLKKLSDLEIADQVVILLGGVGDERAIGPIIDAMRLGSSGRPRIDRRRKIITAGNLALTNITVAEVIWGHGGGIPWDDCPDNPSGCWSKWWQRHKASFHVKEVTESRRYTNYPNYGIYRGLP